jgi:surface polysaccharide O-acyltransferase-like enzyme
MVLKFSKLYYFWQLFKLVAYYKVGRLLEKLGTSRVGSKLLTLIAFLGAAIAWKIAGKIWGWMLDKCFKYESLSACDEIFLHYNEGIPPTVVACFIVDKFDYEEMRKWFL